MARVRSDAAVHIGARIRKIRESQQPRKWTQDKLGVETDIDSSNIRAYELGLQLPSIYTLVRIAKALNVEPGYFLDGLELDMFPASEKKS